MKISDCIPAVISGVYALEREGLVTPMIVTFDAGNGWRLCKFKALPGHPKPGNAGRGFTRPHAPVTAYERTQATIPALRIEGEDEAIFAQLREVMDALGWTGEPGIDMQVMRRPDKSIACADIMRGGVINFEDYPDAGAAPEVEVVDGTEAIHFGGDGERGRVRKSRAKEAALPITWTPSAMGRKGGSAISEAKARASRANGRKGGRKKA